MRPFHVDHSQAWPSITNKIMRERSFGQSLISDNTWLLACSTPSDKLILLFTTTITIAIAMSIRWIMYYQELFVCTVEGGMQHLGLSLWKSNINKIIASVLATLSMLFCTGASFPVEVILSQTLSGRRLGTLAMAITGPQLLRL